MSKSKARQRREAAVVPLCEGMHYREDKRPQWVLCRELATAAVKLRVELTRTRKRGFMHACDDCAQRYADQGMVIERVTL